MQYCMFLLLCNAPFIGSLSRAHRGKDGIIYNAIGGGMKSSQLTNVKLCKVVLRRMEKAAQISPNLLLTFANPQHEIQIQL